MAWVCGEVPRGRVPGVVVAKHQCVGGCVVICVLEPRDDRSKLQKLFEVDARSIRECDRASYDGGERGSVSIRTSGRRHAGCQHVLRRHVNKMWHHGKLVLDITI